MQSQISLLADFSPAEDWAYSSPDHPSTIVVEVLSGDLDPRLLALNAGQDIITSNDDFAPAFGPAARLTLPPGDYTLRVETVYGAGDYQITALPGTMHRQWDEDFAAENPFWAIPNASPFREALQLQTPLTTTRLFTPLSAPPLNELYLQARFVWGETRPETEAGLMLRGEVKAGGQIAGYRLEARPDGRWALRLNDGVGGETLLAEGQLPIADSPTLGLLAEGEVVSAWAEGQKLAEVRNTALLDETAWGLVIYDGQILLEDFWLAIPAAPPPDYPPQLSSQDPATIAAEIGWEGGERALLIPRLSYNVAGAEQRNFLMTEAEQTFGDFILGGRVILTQGDNLGCGLIGRFNGRDNKLFGFADRGGGAGLLLWVGGPIRLNNYTLLGLSNPAETRQVLVMRDQYAAWYVEGELAALALVPLRRGNAGVAIINYDPGPAACDFRDLWIWE
jgi:hypothetical protein